MGNMEVISVNLWQILVSLANLLILFLLFKKFLFKPVQSVLDKRRAAIESDFAAANAAKQAALASRAEYEEKLVEAFRRATADHKRKVVDLLSNGKAEWDQESRMIFPVTEGREMQRIL